MTSSWRKALAGITPAYASIAPDGTLYVTSNSATGCTLFALDGATGEQKWCKGRDQLSGAAAASTPLIDRDGNIYIADDRIMASFSPDGRLRWSTRTVDYNPLSAQFTPDGNLLFITYSGTLFVLKRDSGAQVLRRDLAPNIVPNPADCLSGGDGCPVANTPAIDPETGLIVFTFWPPQAPRAEVRAMQYIPGTAPRIEERWTNDDLVGGSGSSPDLSADGSRVYVHNNNNELLALNATNGTTIWGYDVGYDAAGSPSTSADGVIIPASSTGGDPMKALTERDTNGDGRLEPVLLWEKTEGVDAEQIGVPAQAAGGVGYAFVRPPSGSGGVSLLTFDARSGAELDLDAVPGLSATTVGTSIGPRGEVVTASLAGTVYSFRPSSS